MDINTKLRLEDLPSEFHKILDQIIEIKNILHLKHSREPTAKKMSFEMTIKFIEKQGFLISKSKLYKLTSKKEIPFHRFNQKLVFEQTEIIKWLEKQIKKDNTYDESIKSIIRSSQKRKK